MLEAGLEALLILLSPDRLVWLMAGIGLGIVVGLLPGLGGVAGMSILLPFVYGMDPYSGIALMIGLMAVTSTSDTFPAVLIGVPGSAGAQATVMDGYPLARQGEAGRALGAAFVASMFGGVIGAVALFVALPIARPLVLALGSPELFVLTLFGVSMVGILSRGMPRAGVLMGLIGFLVAAIGPAPSTGQYRYAFDSFYLSGGISLMIITLGLFAIPEFLDLLVEGSRISRAGAKLRKGLWDGAKDTLHHKSLVARSSIVGVLLGIIPGLGGAAVNWVIYGMTAQASKNNEGFGKGDIRGVIAPEAANNAVDGGALIPTVLFGIPGSGSTAILLGGLILMGITPGPSMLEDDQLPSLLVIMWSLGFANILATGLCFLLSRPLVRLSVVRARTLVPFLMVIVTIAAYQNSESWGDIVALMVVGAIGWALKHVGWPRAPLLIGFVLGPSTERYLGLSVGRYGLEWLRDPTVIVIIVLVVVSIVLAVRTIRRDRRKARAASPAPTPQEGTSK